jgi:hypothetical protein
MEYPEWADWDRCGGGEGTSCPGAAVAPYGNCLGHLDERAWADFAARHLTTMDLAIDLRGATVSESRTRQISDLFEDDSPLLGRFVRSVLLDHATVRGDLLIAHAAVAEDISMAAACFEKTLFIVDCSARLVSFGHDARVHGDILISEVRADGIVSGNLQAGGRTMILDTTTKRSINLEEAIFSGLVTMRVACSSLLLRDAVLNHGMFAQVGKADVRMEQTSLGRRSRIAYQLEDVLHLTKERDLGTRPSRPRMISMTGCDLSKLALHDIDLGPCRFWGAFDLDKLDIEGPLILSEPPGRWRTRRKVIFDEILWRTTYRPARFFDGWFIPWSALPKDELLRDERESALTGRDAVGDARTVAGVYRGLRKGLEDRKDEPGAADLYYGEMEMRRLGARAPIERSLLTAYWLVAGYGLRAWRALATLAVVLALGVVAFLLVGFAATTMTGYVQVKGQSAFVPYTVQGAKPSVATAIDYAVESATSLLRSPSLQPRLTVSGEVVEMVLRFAGPVLVGLAVLSVRGRVKR